MSSDEIRIEAWFAAPVSSVFDAWIEPRQLAAWFAAGDWQVTRVEFQPITGTRWQVDFAHPDGRRYSETGVLLDVKHAERLEFTLTQTGLELPALETHIVVTFTAENDGTRVVLRQTGFGLDRTRRDSNDAGWRTCFDKLRLALGRHASCSCGQLQIETSGEPVRISVCHCLACQKRTGSAFGVQARFARKNVAITGRSSQYVRTGDSGGECTFHFCPDCGSTVHWQLAQFPDVIAIAVGAFADPTFPAPAFSVYEERQHQWVELAGQIEHAD
jgi:uncharacterized protein YndB with AHSA1/START domain